MAGERSRRISPRKLAKTAMHRFEEPGKYVVYSQPKFLVTLEDQQELVDCEARMIVSSGKVKKTANGRRRIELTVEEWDAVGKSRLLNGEIRYTLTKSPKGDFIAAKGSVTGGSTAADLPGAMVIKGTFDTFLNGNTVSKAHVGEARGVISAFPPKQGDLFDISGSEVRVGPVIVQGILCACSAKQ